MSRRFFDNQPNEICSHLSEKALEGTFLVSPRSSQIIVMKEKEGRKRKSEEKNSKNISNLGPLRKKSRMTKDVSIKLTGDRGNPTCEIRLLTRLSLSRLLR